MWTAIYSFVPYVVGNAITKASTPVDIALGIAAVLLADGIVLIRRPAARLVDQAEAATPAHYSYAQPHFCISTVGEGPDSARLGIALVGHRDEHYIGACNWCYLHCMAEASTMRWLVLVVRLPAQPSRHRVAVWRELRKVGALSLGQGVWAVPDVPIFADGVQRALDLAERANGERLVLQATGRGPDDSARFEAIFTAAREEDWAEFIADCGKYTTELDKEIATGKLTLAELEEEEQSLERLRRWHRDLRVRDVFGAAAGGEADRQLAECVRRFEDYSERVFTGLHAFSTDADEQAR